MLMNKMSNRNYFESNKLPSNYRLNNFTNEQDFYKLPAINKETSTIKDPYISRGNNNYPTQVSNLNNANYKTTDTNNLSVPVSSTHYPPAIDKTRSQLSNNDKTKSIPRIVTSSQTFSPSPGTSNMNTMMPPAPLINRTWSSNQIVAVDKTKSTNMDVNKTTLINQDSNSLLPPRRPMTSSSNNLNSSSSNMNTSNGQKIIIRDHRLANEILQKAGLTSTITPNDCIEVITDTPVTSNDDVYCDPDPLCMKKPVESQELYEQPIVVRHLQLPQPIVPSPIIIREHYAQQPPTPQPPIVIRKVPPRPSTPPTLIIRECPPALIDLQEPTIIDREVPLPLPAPRQVIVEQYPTPPAKPRSIIVEKWLPFQEPQDRPCIVEKASRNDIPPKNVIIQYESVEPKIQPQCINEGVSFVDPKQYINDKPNGNVEVCYVDQLSNLPDHIKCQLSPEVLAALGIQNDNKQTTYDNPPPPRNNPTISMPPKLSQQPATPNRCHSVKPPYAQLNNPNSSRYQQKQQANNRVLSAVTSGLPPCYKKYNPSMFTRSNNLGFSSFARTHYNPWATTYQISFSNKARGICRTH